MGRDLLPDDYPGHDAYGLGSEHNTSWGTVTIRDGQATFEMQPPLYECSITLSLDGGQRTLALDGLWDSFTAQMTAPR
jgi:hypothetical protein